MSDLLHHVVTGDRAAIALLLVHAVGADLRMWEECAAIWSRRFCVVACDLRGAGRTPSPDRPWRPADHVRDLEAVRELLGLTRVISIGCASGAFVAASYAATYAQRAIGVVISDGKARIDAQSRERVESRLALVRKGTMQAVIPAAIDLAFTGMPKGERYDRYTARFAQNDPQGYAMLALGMLDSDLAPVLQSIAVPSLVLVGEHDMIYPVAKAREIHALLRGSELKILEGASHLPPYQAPELFAQTVEEFISRRIQLA